MDDRGALTAVQELDGKRFGGRTLHVNVAYHEQR